MAAPTVTNVFVNGAGNVIDATEVNQNFADMVAGFGAGTGDLNIDSIVMNSAVVNGNVNATGAISAASLYVSGVDLTPSYINSCAISAIAAYDFADIVSASMSYVSGVFTATVSGITDGSGNQRTFTASYIRQRNLVHVFIPAHNGTTDTGFQGQGYEQELAYVMTGFPAEISPSATKTIDLPMGALYSGSALYANTVGIFGDTNWAGSGLSCLAIQNQAGYWGGGTASKGYNRPVIFTYSI
jgi:hypothetical protein